MSNFSDGNSFEDILQRMLDMIPDTLDKRQGSIIYDALAPAAAELAQCYIALDVYADQSYLLTAVGENLDMKVYDYGLSRNPATFAQRIGTFVDTNNANIEVEIGSRWSVPVENGGYIYKVLENTEPGKYILECESAGTIGNEYFGTILPLEPINNLGSATLTSIYIAGIEKESDENLRERAKEKINAKSFGGNIDEYKEYTKSINGVGDCLVIPIWNGGGTVKLVIVTNTYDIPSTSFINNVQTLIDPTQNSGLGYGIAPIGHKVTVVAPTKLELTIDCNIVLAEGYTITSLQSQINEAIKKYLLEVQKAWFIDDTVTIYNSRMIAALLSVNGIVNVNYVKINDSTDDLIITPSEDNNKYPIIKEVNVVES